MKRGLLLLMIISFAFLSGCQKVSKPSSSLLFAQSGVLCTANNLKARKKYSAWARDDYAARAYALSRCQSRSVRGKQCQISDCIATGGTTEVSTSRWYTCYVTNHDKKGVWTSTAHERLDSIKLAFERCAKYSGSKKACYVNYCRLW